MATQLWIVGRMEMQPWEFVGVFATEAEARAACLSPKYFVGPAVLGEATPVERTEWPGCYYPIVEHEGSGEQIIVTYEEWKAIANGTER